MGLIDALRDALTPDTEAGVVHECADCRTVVDEPRRRCPECGSTEIVEREGFEFRPAGERRQ
ncbi:PhlB family protein [Halorarum salinum]|uniref:Small CPxCG-related zinc finger protein n=1 Tax=Halorarum salinum TaxID=2743089 RepID=A0A7D5QFK2_9EURY|nr:hypothetical protein [Halobaculum salinum]QLG61442.1 hypothetical protein HUG12_06710 [Halobaculum salinum]